MSYIDYYRPQTDFLLSSQYLGTVTTTPTLQIVCKQCTMMMINSCSTVNINSICSASSLASVAAPSSILSSHLQDWFFSSSSDNISFNQATFTATWNPAILGIHDYDWLIDSDYFNESSLSVRHVPDSFHQK